MHPLRALRKGLSILAVCAACVGCATPTERAYTLARAAGLEPIVLDGSSFRHLAYVRHATVEHARLHVYIDHDGSPWLAGRVAADPTPRNPLGLRLIALDPAPSLYVGRPCHFGVDARPPCHPLLWTHARYGDEVVSSMALAIERFLESTAFTEVVLIGYSGGATIAVLLAERLPQTVAVVTLAGNLDVEAWSRLHGHTPLTGSMNPAARVPLRASIEQIHYVGSSDRNVPPALARAYGRRHSNARIVEIEEFDHVCCWEAHWPKILASPPFR